MNQLAFFPGSVRNAVYRYNNELKHSCDLSNRLPFVRSWYAIQDENGNWKFGPSKWVGYERLDVDTYLNQSNRGLDGRETEAHLRQWFQVVDSTSELYDYLSSNLTAFLAKYDKSPNKIMRINVRKDVGVN